MRQAAWLASYPKEMNGQSRGQWIRRYHGAEKAEAFQVDPGHLWWLLDMLDDAGGYRVEATFDGLTFLPLQWPDLQAWASCVGEAIPARFLRDLLFLSRQVAAQTRASREVGCQAPYDPGE